MYVAIITDRSEDFMSDALRSQVRRIGIDDCLAAPEPHDYADAFEVQVPLGDVCRPEAWVRAGLELTPAWVKRVIGGFGSRKQAAPTAGRSGPFRMVHTDESEVRLEATLSFVRVTMIGRNRDNARRVLLTVLNFERPVIGRLIWVLLGVGHRWAAPRIITSRVSEQMP
ncbi:hypothetical protein ABZX12_41015 [Kribbella sp. NPDC003505]|uniref:hypothetical protein n=1 Tax=Kribbella sp. NPDC003505 TaxID=3154448 RepID=UPI0033A9CAC5